MIEVRGLSDDVYELMLANAQNRIVQSFELQQQMVIQVVW